MDNSVAGGNQTKSLPEIAQNADDNGGCLDSEFGSFEFVELTISEIVAGKEAEEDVLVAGINDIAMTENPVGNNLIGQQRTSRTFFRPTGLGLDSRAENGDQIPDNVIECPRCRYMNLHDQCTICDYKFRTEGRPKKHMQDTHTHHEDGVSATGIATSPPSATLTTTYQVQQNSPNKGGGSGEEQCQQSTAWDSFPAPPEAKDAETISKNIPMQKQLKCTHCEYSTEYKHHLEYHYRSHSGQEPIKCSTCDYTCVNKAMLNSHMRTHTPNYQFRCQDCQYQTKYCHSFKMHLKKYGHKGATGTGGSESSDNHVLNEQQALASTYQRLTAQLQEQLAPELPMITIPGQAAGNLPFFCQRCEIAFKDAVLYQLHRGYHTIESPFKCNRCGHLSRSTIEFNLHLYQTGHE